MQELRYKNIPCFGSGISPNFNLVSRLREFLLSGHCHRALSFELQTGRRHPCDFDPRRSEAAFLSLALSDLAGFTLDRREKHGILQGLPSVKPASTAMNPPAICFRMRCLQGATQAYLLRSNRTSPLSTWSFALSFIRTIPKVPDHCVSRQ